MQGLQFPPLSFLVPVFGFFSFFVTKTSDALCWRTAVAWASFFYCGMSRKGRIFGTNGMIVAMLMITFYNNTTGFKWRMTSQLAAGFEVAFVLIEKKKKVVLICRFAIRIRSLFLEAGRKTEPVNSHLPRAK